MVVQVCTLLLVLLYILQPTWACNGYNFKLNSVKNCNDNNVIKASPDFNVVMDQDCNLIFSGCVTISKPVKTAKGTYSIKKAPFPPMEGELDFCESISQIEFPQLREGLKVFGLTNKCPYAAKKVCATPNKKISLAMFKSQLGLAVGTTEIKFDVEHDTGKTCVESNFTFSKVRKG